MKRIIFGVCVFFTLFSFLNGQWAKTYGGSGDDVVYSIVQTSEGGYVVAGILEQGDPLDQYSWILKLDSDGNIEWQNGELWSIWRVRPEQTLWSTITCINNTPTTIIFC